MKNTIFILISITLFISSCTSKKKENSNKQLIVTTTGMLYDATLNVTGQNKDFELVALMGPGVDPHLYKPTLKDTELLRKADVIILNGLHLEGKMSDILHKLTNKKTVIYAGDKIPNTELITEGTVDPHIWFSVKLWKMATKNISESLIKKYPNSQAKFQENTTQYLAKLDELDQHIRKQISLIPESQRILVTAHDAFNYFGKEYNIKVEGLQGLSTVSDIGLKDISKITELVISNNIKAVFIETSVSDKAIKSVIQGCKEKNHSLSIGGALYSDAMGEIGTEEGTYIGMFKKNIETITNALK